MVISESPTPFITKEPSDAPSPEPSITPAPSPTVELTKGSEVISKVILQCIPLEHFAKCADETLNMEFEYPIVWGEIEAVLRTGWDSGYAYNYSFSGGTISARYLSEAAGLSIDFAEGREIYPLDFAGFGNETLLRTNSCEERNLYPICEYINSDVRWMIRFPNAKYFCESSHRNTSPVFRIEVNLPENPRINGFVFEVPFLSDTIYQDLRERIYPLLLFEPNLVPSVETCKIENREPFDKQVMKFIERLKTKSLDVETEKNLEDLMHLAESIVLR